MEKNTFLDLNSANVNDKIKSIVNERRGTKLDYLPWAAAWSEILKYDPQASFYIHEQIIDNYGNTRFWFDDGKTGWVKVSMIINGEEKTEVLPIMDYKNESISAENITSADANKAYKRCLVKCIALHGLGLYIYSDEDLPEAESQIIELKEKIKEIVAKKVKISDKAKEKTAELCKAAEKKANPNLEEDLISGNYNNINDFEILSELKDNLLAIRK